MATGWAEVVSAAMVQINDIRLQQELAVSPALFYRRMSALVEQALTLLSSPPELLKFIQAGMEKPTYADYEWTSTSESLQGEAQVDTGAVGYDLCSAVSRVTIDDSGAVTLVPYTGASYDAETGVVTFPQQESAGVEYALDFYTDGSFPSLTWSQIRLFALAIAQVWDERFSRDWGAMTPKVHDDTFNAPNEPQWMEKSDKRLHNNRGSFNDELKKYEQSCAFAASVSNTGKSIILI